MSAAAERRSEERLVASLTALYEAHGYAPYKMSRFEPYDLYVRNKDFLISDGVITFTDTNGSLLALKPDVTLSIVRSTGEVQPGTVRKVYYNEHVYRVSSNTHAFGELMQSGLECIGDMDAFTLGEVLAIALEALAAISQDAVLDLSHLGIVTSLLDDADAPQETRRVILRSLAEKNAHELKRVCSEAGMPVPICEALSALAAVSGTPEEALAALEPVLKDVPDQDAVRQFRSVLGALESSPHAGMLRVDFSAIGDPKYYNGFVFQGYVKGLPERVLSGGQYDRLMRRMHSEAGAVGFAVYLDALAMLFADPDPYDADVLLLYDEETPIADVSLAVNKLIAEGCSVSAQRAVPPKQRFRRTMKLREGEVIPLA